MVLVYILFGVYCFVFGDNGVLERTWLVQAKDAIKNSIARLTQENSSLQKDYSIISNNHTNDNFYKEEASKSGYISKGEKYIFFKSSEKKEILNSNSAPKEDYPVNIAHIRILWIIISIIVLFLYFWKKNRKKSNLEENIKV